MPPRIEALRDNSKPAPSASSRMGTAWFVMFLLTFLILIVIFIAWWADCAKASAAAATTKASSEEEIIEEPVEPSPSPVSIIEEEPWKSPSMCRRDISASKKYVSF